ncbi:MAG TPA: hypothetical protein VHR42_03245 [Clostridia bacterium]|nr:hypothetical protein [Clostridia bacterium]
MQNKHFIVILIMGVFLLSSCAEKNGIHKIVVYSGDSESVSQSGGAESGSQVSRSASTGGGEDCTQADFGSKSVRSSSGGQKAGIRSSVGGQSTEGGSGASSVSADPIELYNRAALLLNQAQGLRFDFENCYIGKSQRTDRGSVRLEKGGSLKLSEDLTVSMAGAPTDKRVLYYYNGRTMYEQKFIGDTRSTVRETPGDTPDRCNVLLYPRLQRSSVKNASCAKSPNGWTVRLELGPSDVYHGVYGILDPDYQQVSGDQITSVSQEVRLTSAGWISSSVQTIQLRYKGAGLTFRMSKTFDQPGSTVTVTPPGFVY